MVALNKDDGSKYWGYNAYGGGGGYTAPVVTDGKVSFGGTCSIFVTCLDPSNASVKFRVNAFGGMEESVPAIYGNRMFVLNRTGYLYSIK